MVISFVEPNPHTPYQMEKLNKFKNLDNLQGYSISDLNQMRKIVGGLLDDEGGMTTTTGGTYVAQPGGGHPDDSSELRKHE